MLEIIITTAVPLSTKQLESISKAVEKKYGKDVQYVQVVEPQVIGGISIRVGSLELNATVSRKIDQIRSELLANI